MKQMPRRRQGHLNNGGGLDGGQSASAGGGAMGEGDKRNSGSGSSSTSSSSDGGETYNYLHKKFKKVETTACSVVESSSSSTGANPSLEALFQVTGHELQKIQSSSSSNGVDTDEEPKKGHACPYCGLFWGKPSVLQKHIRAHTNERPFPCLTCGFAFKTKSNLYKHCKTRAHHQKANHEGGGNGGGGGVVEAMDTEESEMDEEEMLNHHSPPPPTSSATTTATTATTTVSISTSHGTIYKPKFHSVVVSEVALNEVGDKSPKVATPEFLQQHITKLISQNAAIVDTFDSSWPHRYKRQVSVPANVHLLAASADDNSASSTITKDSSSGSRQHFSDDSSNVVITNDNEAGVIAAAVAAAAVPPPLPKAKNPQNPEGSIIKDLLLKTRMVTPTIRLCGGSVEFTSQQPTHSQDSCTEKNNLYTCHRCNINFKSGENLDAHKRHYCSRLLMMETETTTDANNASQAHKPRGRPKGSKNRPKKEEVRVHSKSVSEGCEDVSRVTSRRNSIALGEGTESIKDILTSVKWSEEMAEMRSSNPIDGPILKKHLLQGGLKVDKNPLPIKKQRFQQEEQPLWRRSQKEFDHIGKAPMRTNNSVHLYGGEVEILDEGSGATKRIVIDSQFYNEQTENPRLLTDVASSVVATIAKPVHNSGGTVLQVTQEASLRALKGPVCIPLPQVSASCSSGGLKTSTVTSVVVSASKSVESTATTVSTSTAIRPTSLSLNASHSSMMGTTLVSPETPRPNRKYGQCYFNGQYYTYLELKQSTRVYYCCIFRPQPMYIPQLTDPKLSMYSVWQTVPPTPDPIGLNPSRAMALYNSRTRTGSVYSTAPRAVLDLTLTHSTYWTFQQKKKEREKFGEKVVEQETSSTTTTASTTTTKQPLPPPPPPPAPPLQPQPPQQPPQTQAQAGVVKMTEEYTYVRGRGRGKYICHECGIRCKKPSMLKKHVRTHTDVRPYTCKHCNFSFKTKGNLTKHMKSKAHHKKCVELGIVPVPITIDDAQIDEEAVQRQERIEHQRKQFANDEDSEMDEDEEEEEEEEEEYDEEDGVSQMRFKEGEEEEDTEEEEAEEPAVVVVEAEGQFDDAPEPHTINKKTHTEQEIAARSLLDLGQPSLNRSVAEPNQQPEAAKELSLSSTGFERSKAAVTTTTTTGECDQPMDLSMPHQRTPQEEIEEEEEEWSEDDSEDIVVDDDQPNHLVEVSEGKKVDVPTSPWSTAAAATLSRQMFEGGGGSSSCHPTPGVTQIYPTGPAVLPRPQAISTYMHRSMEDGKCVCTICNKSFSKPSQLRLHFNIHYFERPFRCDSCAISFRTKGHLQKHRRSVSHYNKVNMNMTFGTPTMDNPRPFKCPDCKIAFRIHGHLAKHLRSKMHIMKLECLGKLPFGTYAEIERSGANLNEIDTTDCDNSLESLQVMAHRLVDKTSPSNNVPWTRERTISGGSCDDHSDGLPYVAKSGSEEDLSRLNRGGPPTAHDYEDISDEEEHQQPSQLLLALRCHQCGKQEKSAKCLQVHTYLEHSDNNNKASSSIKGGDPSAATERAVMERAVMVLDGGGVGGGGGTKTESEVSCELCGELCSSQQDLSQHLLSHARCRPFICTLCDAAFTSIHYLKLHLVTHQQGFVFGCEECGSSFSSVAELDLHIDGRHSGAPAEGVR